MPTTPAAKPTAKQIREAAEAAEAEAARLNTICGRITNRHEFNRFRLRLPTGEVYEKNGQKVPVIETHWLLGTRDADPNDPQLNDSMELTGFQVAQVKANAGLMGLVKMGKLHLEG